MTVTRLNRMPKKRMKSSRTRKKMTSKTKKKRSQDPIRKSLKS